MSKVNTEAKSEKKVANASAKTYLNDLEGMEGKWTTLIAQLGGSQADSSAKTDYLNRLRAEGSGL